MYSHRTSTNKDRMYKIIRINNERYIYLFVENFVLPREEARRLFRAYNHVWDLKMDEDKLQRVLDACARNGNIAVDEALKLFAK
jgi:hypothetical protein